MRNKAFFIDRDGILNKVVFRDGEAGSPRHISEFEISAAAGDMVRAARNLGFLTVVVTNQPDIGRKKMKPAELARMNEAVSRELPLDFINVCTSCDDGDFRRKPNPGMLLEAMEAFAINPASSFLLGDSEKDLLAGERAGVRTILLKTGYNAAVQSRAGFCVDSLDEVVPLLRTAAGEAG